MIATVVISATVLMIAATVFFLFARYVPIITNLFMNVTIRRPHGEHDAFEGETVTFTSTDGVQLVGTLAAAEDDDATAPIVVFCHEFTSDRHSVTKYGGFLRGAGFRVFSFDFRGHGDSGTSTGYQPRQWVTEHEICDLKAALRYLRGREDLAGASVTLFGVSRGAASALIAAADEAAVAAVVSDSAFSTPHTLHSYMRRWAPIFVHTRLLLLSTPEIVFSVFRLLATRLAEHRVGVRFTPLVPALKRLRKPVLFMHGERDNYIGVEQAHFLHDSAVADKQLWIAPQADHNRAVDADPDEYSRRVVRFLNTSLNVTEAAVTTVT